MDIIICCLYMLFVGVVSKGSIIMFLGVPRLISVNSYVVTFYYINFVLLSLDTGTEDMEPSYDSNVSHTVDLVVRNIKGHLN